MKKLLVAAIMMMASVATFAQNEVGQITVMPKIGLNISDLQKADDTNTRCGLAVGAEFEYGLTDMVGLSAGLIYSMQGAKDAGTMKADYINIPILANVYVMKGLAVKLGLQPGLNVNSEYELSGQNVNIDAKTFDLSIPVGVSYQFNNIVIDGRYNYGVTKAFDGADYKNSVFQITVGYKFAL